MSSCNAALKWVSANGPRFAAQTVALEHKTMAGYLRIDFETIKQLELVGNLSNPRSKRGTLLQALDHCKTKMGQRMLRSTLYQPLSDRNAIRDRQAVVEILRNDENFSNYLEAALCSLNDQDSINNALSRRMRTEVDVTNLSADGASKFLLSVLALQSNLKVLPALVEKLGAAKRNSNLLNRHHDQLSDHEYSTLRLAISRTIDEEHEYSPKMAMRSKRNALITTVKTGISGELDTAKTLYYSIQDHVRCPTPSLSL